MDHFQQPCYQKLAPGNPASKTRVSPRDHGSGKIIGFLDYTGQEMIDHLERMDMDLEI